MQQNQGRGKLTAIQSTSRNSKKSQVILTLHVKELDSEEQRPKLVEGNNKDQSKNK